MTQEKVYTTFIYFIATKRLRKECPLVRPRTVKFLPSFQKRGISAYVQTGKKGKGMGMRVKLDQPAFKSDGEMKSRAANQDGYFDKEFRRVFEVNLWFHKRTPIR